MWWRRAIVVAGLLSGLSCSSVTISTGTDVGQGERATVVRVVDGDTAVLRVDGKEERVRFIGMDTPERSDPLGPNATAFTKTLLPVGHEIFLTYDAGLRDRYGRLLAYLWPRPPDETEPGEMINARIVTAGWARTLTIPPNVKHADLFRALQTKARTAKRGMWGTEPFPATT